MSFRPYSKNHTHGHASLLEHFDYFGCNLYASSYFSIYFLTSPEARFSRGRTPQETTIKKLEIVWGPLLTNYETIHSIFMALRSHMMNLNHSKISRFNPCNHPPWLRFSFFNIKIIFLLQLIQQTLFSWIQDLLTLSLVFSTGEGRILLWNPIIENIEPLKMNTLFYWDFLKSLYS